MKASYLILASLAALPALCAAQSHVVLYGIVDTGVAYVSNQQGSQAWKAQSSNLSGNRWGLNRLLKFDPA